MHDQISLKKILQKRIKKRKRLRKVSNRLKKNSM